MSSNYCHQNIIEGSYNGGEFCIMTLIYFCQVTRMFTISSLILDTLVYTKTYKDKSLIKKTSDFLYVLYYWTPNIDLESLSTYFFNREKSIHLIKFKDKVGKVLLLVTKFHVGTM